MAGEKTGERIVVGTDGSETAKRAVGEAMRLAKASGGEIHVVSAYEPVRGARIKGAPEVPAAIWAPASDEKVRVLLDEAATAARAAGIQVETHAIDDAPADALLEVAKDVDADLIVVGNKGMHGVKRFVLGSVPNRVSHMAECNVLIVATDDA